MYVREWMSSPVLTLDADTSYHTALHMMQERHFHHVPVVSAEGSLIGIIAERDLILAASHFLRTSIEISEIMHHGVVTTTPETSLEEAASLMIQHKIGGLPVLDESGAIVGILTETDMLRAFLKAIGSEPSQQPMTTLESGA